MNLANQKRISAEMLGTGKSKVWFDPDKLDDIKEAITKRDIKGLIKKKIIQRRPELGHSRVRANKRLVQKRKGRQQGPGSRKGSMFARLSRKKTWMILVRKQRALLRELKEKDLIDVSTNRDVYMKIKGGYFRNVRHIKLYLTEHKLFIEKKK